VTIHEAYRILGLSHDATAAQVKSAYRRLVAEAHPDRGGEAAKFIRIRAAYEILHAFLQQGPLEDDIPISADLRGVIDSIVAEFREHQRRAEAETQAHMRTFEMRMKSYIQSASRAELRQFSGTFRNSWDAIVSALFTNCNARCDETLKEYESWYTKSTQAFFDRLYRRELLRFPRRRRFWEAFAILGAVAAALSLVIGWTPPVRLSMSAVLIASALGLSFLYYRWGVIKARKTRERVEPLSVVPFELQAGARFPTEVTLRRGRRRTAALGTAGMFLGNAAAGGVATPLLGAVAGAAVGGVIDRLFNPTAQMKAGLVGDVEQFMRVARPQVMAYVLEAHDELLTQVRDDIVANYQERVKNNVKLLNAPAGSGRVRGTRRRGVEGGSVVSPGVDEAGVDGATR